MGSCSWSRFFDSRGECCSAAWHQIIAQGVQQIFWIEPRVSLNLLNRTTKWFKSLTEAPSHSISFPLKFQSLILLFSTLLNQKFFFLRDLQRPHKLSLLIPLRLKHPNSTHIGAPSSLLPLKTECLCDNKLHSSLFHPWIFVGASWEWVSGFHS